MSFTIELIIITITIVTSLILIYYRSAFNHWKKKGLPYLEPKFPFGTMENPLTRTHSLGTLMRETYDTLKSRGHKHGGLYNFTSPMYIPVAPEMVKNVMQNDFEHFVDRGSYYNERDDPLTAHLFAIGGEKWRTLRTKLTPTFTSGKMKTMLDMIIKCGEQMRSAVDEMLLPLNNESLDIKDVISRFTTDSIGSCAFGLECNSFVNPDADFRKHGKIVHDPSKFKAVKHIFGTAQPDIARFMGVTLLPKRSAKFFFDVIKETVNYREKNEFVRRDMIQLLIELKNSEKGAKQLTIEEMAAQAFIFFVGGFETSSTTMTFCLYELARNRNIQQRLRKETEQVLRRYGGKITYEALGEMKYMDQVIDEALRLYPPLPFLNRLCVKDYKIPETDVVIEKGTLLYISLLGLHHDPEFFPDPERFDPERFSEENKKHIRPFTYIPFGAGPRICIGLRFGMMQMKIGLSVLISNYEFSLSDMTKTPLTISPFTIVLTPEQCIYLNTKRIHQDAA